MVKGSDSGQKFAKNCRVTCKKKCLDSDSCKNMNRRINIYTSYVSTNYDVLSKEYAFFGVIDDVNEPFEKYKSMTLYLFKEK